MATTLEMANTIEETKVTTDWRSDIWSLVRKQGLAYITMLFLAWYFYNENQKLKDDIQAAKTEVVNYYKNDNAEMRRVLIENNRIINRNNDIFEDFLKSKRK